jgi:hypothetical protein
MSVTVVFLSTLTEEADRQTILKLLSEEWQKQADTGHLLQRNLT